MNKLTKQQEELILSIYNRFVNSEDVSSTHHEVNPGLKKSSRENYLYFLMSCTINFQRNSYALWKSSLATWNDPKTNYLFYPEKVVETKFEKLQKDMAKHKLALQKNKHPTIWLKISTTLNKY